MRIVSIILFCAVCLLSGGASAGSNHMTVGALTNAPSAWLVFCGKYAGQCGNKDTKHFYISDDDRAFAELSRVNKEVNARVKPMSDMDHWGVLDQWDLPRDSTGDCEDYALEKRRILMEEGVPSQVILLTFAMDTEGKGHVVLTAHMQSGDYILDNLVDDIHVWHETNYQFIKRQSYDNQGQWVLVGTPDIPTASVR